MRVPTDEVNLPSAENVASQPLLLEVSNGVIPSTVTTVVATGSFDTTAAPSVDDVVSYLKANGVHCEGKKIEVISLSWLKTRMSIDYLIV